MEWIKVEDKLPDRNMKVKWICEDGIEDIGFYYFDTKIFASVDLLSLKPVISWQHLTP